MPLLNSTELHERLPFLGRPGASPAAPAPASASASSPTTSASHAITTTLHLAGRVAEKASSTAASALATSISMADGSTSPHVTLSNTTGSATNDTSSHDTTSADKNTSLAILVVGAILILLTATSLAIALVALYKLWQQTLNLQYVITQLKAMILAHGLTAGGGDIEEGGAPPYDPSLDHDAKSLESSEAWDVHPGTRVGTDVPSLKPRLKPVPFSSFLRSPGAAKGRSRAKVQVGEEDVMFSLSRGSSPMSNFGGRSRSRERSSWL